MEITKLQSPPPLEPHALYVSTSRGMNFLSVSGVGASCLLGRLSTTWATSPALFALIYFSDRVLQFCLLKVCSVLLVPKCVSLA
jgi:hypothetical protein